MKILWIVLNSSYAHASLALPAIHAQIKGNPDIEWEIVSCTINENIGMIVKNAAKCKPHIIAATAWLFNKEILLHIICRLKALLPNSKVILGGPEFLGNNKDFLLSTPFVDCVFRGEGEENVPLWLQIWDKPEKWNMIEGICFLDSQKQYIDKGIARVQYFEKLIPPEESKFFNWEKPFVQLETTRGCFNTCAFCVSGGEKPVRTINTEQIRKRLQIIQQHKIKNVRVLDRTFNYNNKRALELLKLFREFPEIRFHLEIHPALLTNELKTALADMPTGCLHLEAGIQSLHENVLMQSRRSGDLQRSLEGLRYLCSLTNMETHADLIAGLPLYKLEQIFEDIHVLTHFRAGEIQLESLKVLPGTEMRKRAEEWGIRYSPYPPYEVLETNEITAEELQYARQLSRLLDGYYNTPVWQKITRQLILSESGFLKSFLNFLIASDVIDKPLSIEKRGLLLYDFCKQVYPEYTVHVSVAWIIAGLSLKKAPAEKVMTKHQNPPSAWNILQGKYKDSLKLCRLPHKTGNYWFGFEPETQIHVPVFIAEN